MANGRIKQATQKGTRPSRLWIEKDAGRRPLLDNRAVIQNDNLVGDVFCEGHFMRHHDHGHTVARQAAHDVQYFAHELWIECRSRLIEQHELRAHCQNASYAHALLLPTR